MVKVDGGRWGGLHAGMSKVGNSYELLTTYEAATTSCHHAFYIFIITYNMLSSITLLVLFLGGMKMSGPCVDYDTLPNCLIFLGHHLRALILKALRRQCTEVDVSSILLWTMYEKCMYRFNMIHLKLRVNCVRSR